jgi:acyl-CoA synthetase (AMP-forming)/AMP-acid ligase II
MRAEPGLRPEDRLLAVTTVSFDISVLELFLPLTVGGCAVVAASDEAADGAALLRLIEAEGITVMQATPSTWRLLIEAGWKGHDRFKALCGGEAFPLDLRAAMLERCAEVWNLYGPTETTVWSACGRLRPEGRITVGKPIANSDILVLDDAGHALPPGLPGEVWIGGAGVSLGYLKRPDLTAERFKPYPGEPEGGRRMYRTGDLGRWTNDGELEVLGRVDHQVKIRGFRIELPEIEARLAAHPEIRNAVVTVWDAEPDDRRLVAYIATSEAEGLSAIALRKYLRASLPEYMIPQHFVPLPELPLTPNGKVDRKALPPPAVAPAAAVATPSDAERPSTAMEILIAGIWKEIVGRDEVLRNDNFFDLGGHSLLAVRVISRIEQATGWRPSPRLLILENLRELAAHCERAVARPALKRSLFSKLLGLVGSAE